MAELVTEKEMIRSIRDRLPQLLRSDPMLGDYILTITREHFPPKIETEDRFTRMLNELARDREAQERKWEEQNRKWDEVHEELRLNREAQERKWEKQKQEDNRKWEEQNRKWDEAREELRLSREAQERKWEEQKQENNRKWEEKRKEDDRKWEKSEKRLERSIGALGARWGIQTEEAFRDALAGILVENFGVEVINVNEFDDKGEVFGRPDQIELDIIIKNGVLIICELKSSVDKPAMYIFERKVRFYEKRHGRQADRMIVVSPMIEDRARRVGRKLGIEMYPDSLDVPV